MLICHASAVRCPVRATRRFSAKLAFVRCCRASHINPPLPSWPHPFTMGDPMKEWARNGSFIKKPSSGWLHDDAALSHGDGVYYPVKYIGSIPMEMSMRMIRFEERTDVTREAISLCCEAAGLREPRRRKTSRTCRQALSQPAVAKMLNIKLTISTTGIALVVIETNQVIANHIMPCISFATGGDQTDFDVIGYVAKDAHNRRECHVFDCGHMAHDVMATVGQAFELRYKAFLQKGAAPQPVAPVAAPAPRGIPSNGVYGEAVYDDAGTGDSLYSELPDDTGGYSNEEPAVRVQGSGFTYGDDTYDNSYSGYVQRKGNAGTADAGYGEVSYGGEDGGERIYDNQTGAGVVTPKFDQSTYDNAAPGYSELPGGGAEYDEATGDFSATGLKPAPSGSELHRPLEIESWYHGAMQRSQADPLLQYDGDFLVRESSDAPGQYIMSAMHGGQPHHLLLVDPQGIVRTQDMTFESVSHLVNYHLRGQIPIVSRGSRIPLRHAVPRGGSVQAQPAEGMYGDDTYGDAGYLY
eukprot:m.38866 g.38866  ORF g.38866 m.38866 type:complete len:524 (+) comp11215_c0_seq3:133-1704(+)